MERIEFAVEAHDDGTLTIIHFGTRYMHWWLAEVKFKARSATGIAYLYGKRGGNSLITVTKEQAKVLLAAREQAQGLATQAMQKEGN